MKKLLFILLCFCLFSACAVAQPALYTVKHLAATQKISLSGTAVTGIVTDTSLVGVTVSQLATAKTLKDYILNHVDDFKLADGTATGQFPRWSGTAWVGATLVAGDIPSHDASKITSGFFGVATGGTGVATFPAGYLKSPGGTAALTSTATIPGADISGNISGNAANVTGTVATSKGGTGLTTLGTAGQILKVNSGGTALEWAADATGGGGGGISQYSAGTGCMVTATGSGITFARSGANQNTWTFTIPSGVNLVSFTVHNGPSYATVQSTYTLNFNYTSNTLTNQGDVTLFPPTLQVIKEGSGLPYSYIRVGNNGSTGEVIARVQSVSSGNIQLSLEGYTTALSSAQSWVKGSF